MTFISQVEDQRTWIQSDTGTDVMIGGDHYCLHKYRLSDIDLVILASYLQKYHFLSWILYFRIQNLLVQFFKSPLSSSIAVG